MADPYTHTGIKATVEAALSRAFAEGQASGAGDAEAIVRRARELAVEVRTYLPPCNGHQTLCPRCQLLHHLEPMEALLGIGPREALPSAFLHITAAPAGPNPFEGKVQAAIEQQAREDEVLVHRFRSFAMVMPEDVELVIQECGDGHRAKWCRVRGWNRYWWTGLDEDGLPICRWTPVSTGHGWWTGCGLRRASRFDGPTCPCGRRIVMGES